MDSSLEVTDLDEALLVISLKNDEINNLKASIKTTEKKNALRLTDLQFRIDQEKARSAEGDRKLAKAEELAAKIKESLEEQLKRTQEDRQRLTEAINELQTEMRKRQRELKAALFEGQLHLDREKEYNNKLAYELSIIHRHFDPKKILNFLQKPNIEGIPTYLQLYKGNLDKAEQVKQLTLQMERLKSQTYLNIEQSFKKLTSYEAVMESLDMKNKELQESIQKKEEELHLHSQQIYQKKQQLQAIKEHANEQVTQLTDQLQTLKTYVEQSPEEAEDNGHEQQLHYHRTIEQLQQIIQQNQYQLSNLRSEYQERIMHLFQQKQSLKREVSQLHSQLVSQKEDFQSALLSIQREIAEKEDMVLLLNNSIHEQEEFFDGKQQEFDRYVTQLKELLMKRKKAEEESKESQALYRMQVESLTQELSYIKQHFYNAEHSQDGSNQLHLMQDIEDSSQTIQLRRAKSGLGSLKSLEGHHNLFADIREGNDSVEEDKQSQLDIGNYEQQPNWSELYYSLLVKHNEFARRVQVRLEALTAKNKSK